MCDEFTLALHATASKIELLLAVFIVIVKYMIYLPPRIEQCMFVCKSMKLHPPLKMVTERPCL